MEAGFQFERRDAAVDHDNDLDDEARIIIAGVISIVPAESADGAEENGSFEHSPLKAGG